MGKKLIAKPVENLLFELISHTSLNNQPARCQKCGRIFCCSIHRSEHSEKCVVSKLIRNPTVKVRCQEIKAGMSPTSQHKMTPQTKECDITKGIRCEKYQQTGRKRKHVNAVMPVNYNAVSSLLFVKSSLERQKLIAVRGKYKKVATVPRLVTIDEEEANIKPEPVKDSTPHVEIEAVEKADVDQKDTIDPYKAFKSGSLKDSIIFTTPMIKRQLQTISSPLTLNYECQTPKTQIVTCKPSGISSISKSPSKRLAPVGNVKICCSTPNETAIDSPLVANDAVDTSTGLNFNTTKVTALVTPILAEVTPCPISSNKRKLLETLEGSESGTYYTAKSFMSPCFTELTTPLKNPSLFTSVKDAFQHFIRCLPGANKKSATDESIPTSVSPKKKKIKLIGDSPVKCRRTYRNSDDRKSSVFSSWLRSTANHD